jgi:hypothetical protein
MSRYRLEIDATNTIRIWDNETPNEKDAPFILQPDWPSGKPWANREEAESWATSFIAELVIADNLRQETVDSPAEEI